MSHRFIAGVQIACYSGIVITGAPSFRLLRSMSFPSIASYSPNMVPCPTITSSTTPSSTTPPQTARSSALISSVKDPRVPKVDASQDPFTSPNFHLKVRSRNFYPPCALLRNRSSWWKTKIRSANCVVQLDKDPDIVALYLRLVSENTLNVVGSTVQCQKIARVYIFSQDVEDKAAKNSTLCALYSWLWGNPSFPIMPYKVINIIWEGTLKTSAARRKILDHIQKTRDRVPWFEEYPADSLSKHFLADLARHAYDHMPKAPTDGPMPGDFAVYLEEEVARNGN